VKFSERLGAALREVFYEAVRDGVKLARQGKTRVVASSEAGPKRRTARSALDGYLAAAQRALDANASLDPEMAPEVAPDAASVEHVPSK
jgi:hypothetical protein